MEKSSIFKKELSYIKDENIRKSTEVVLDLLPDYFYKIPASSTGKYHPMYATGDAGLVRHVKAAVRFAYELFDAFTYDDKTKDLILMAIIIHDGLKKGLNEEQYTAFDHPLLIGNFLKNNKDKLFLSDEELERVVKMDASHMGKWNTKEGLDIVLPIPKTSEEKFVHLCDYLASRKCIKFEFNENNDILE